MKNVKLEKKKSFEPRVVQYVIEVYGELVVKLFNIGSQMPTLDGHCQYF
jgi:hypothetical protein